MNRIRLGVAALMTGLAGLAVPTGLAGLVPQAALGAAAPSGSSTSPESDSMLTADPMPTWQTNGAVYAAEVVGNVVYVGGSFTSVRPPGAARGVDEVPRTNVAAFNATTGALLPFSHTFTSRSYPINGSYDKTCTLGSAPATYTCDTVYEIRASADGSRIFVGGDFEKIDDKFRTGIGAFSTGTDALTTYRVWGIDGRVRSMAVTSSAVYIGGGFSHVDSQPRERMAALDPESGAVLPFTTTVDGPVIALATSAGDRRLLLAGDFDNVNGVRHRGIMAVDPTTGDNTPWSSNPMTGTAGGSRSYGTDIAVDGDSIYVAANGEGSFDGRLRIDPLTGQVLWTDTCLGATWAVERVGALLFSGSHAHNCTDTAGGFPEAANGINDLADQHWHRFLAETARDGQPTIEYWNPTTNGGNVGKLGPRDLAWNPAGVLWAAGEFTTVNGKAQEGLTRFGVPDLGTTAVPGRPRSPLAMSLTPGTATVTWETADDLDNETLTYQVWRDGRLVFTTTASSRTAWLHPMVRFEDSGLTPGATVRYQVRAIDPSGAQGVKSWDVPVLVASAPDDYRSRVLADGASLYWPLDDWAERYAGGLVDVGGAARYTSTGVTLGAPGVLTQAAANRAVTLDGSTSLIRGQRAMPAPQTLSAELWFKGFRSADLAGFGSERVITSGTVGRALYLDTSGRVVFGVTEGSTRRTVTAAGSVIDGTWHHVVATLGPNGMRLYVDGSLRGTRSTTVSGNAYAGYWHLGGDSLSGWTSAPSNTRFAGSLDEFSVYPTELGASQVLAHYQAGVAAP